MNKHIVIKKYLEKHSLVESNIISYNDFIGRRMQDIVDALSESLDNDEIEIKLGKIRIEKPNIIEADGSTTNITPAEARLRNLTYSAPVFLEINVKQGNQFESHDVEVGRIPVIVKSNICNTYGMSKEDLEKEYNDPLDVGGYFIINGNERAIVMTEDLAENQPFIEKSKGNIMLRLFSKRGAYRIPISITETKEGILETSFSRFKNIPAIVLLKSLGMEKESDISRLISNESDSFIVNLYEFASIHNSEDGLMEIAEKSSLQGTKKEILDRVKQRIDSYFMPHIGLEKKDRMQKAVTLCKLIKQFYIAKNNPGKLTDKDHYANKRVRLSGDLLSDLFRVNLNILVRDIQYTLKKVAKRKKFYSIKTIAKSTLFSHRIESAVATGNWIGERSGVTQNMDKTNHLAMISQLQRVSSMLPGEQENFLARTLHPTHYGRFCPIETPEGTEIGLRKNLSLMSRVSTDIEFDEEILLNDLINFGMIKEKEGQAQQKFDIFYNGKFIGTVDSGEEFVKSIRVKRRINEFPKDLSVKLDGINKLILISTETGRVMRPMVIVEGGISRLTENVEKELKEKKIEWEDLLKKGIIEYIDASEEENAFVAANKKDITEENTHVEVDTIAFLGLVNSLIPFVNHNQSSRLLRGSKTQKQALGIYAANFPVRMDTDVSILHYPQKPLVRSFVYDTLNIYPAGQNMVVAVMTYEGYNMEDAVVLNMGSVQRGLARSTYFRPYASTQINYPGGLSDEITIPEKDVSGYRTETSYRFLEDDGVAYPEAKLDQNEVIIGKTTPPKFLSEAREISIKTRKEGSSVIRQEEKGTVDLVVVTEDNEGNKVVQARTRDERIPELGDKFSSPHGQKGIVGAIIPEEDIPFTSKGVKPDLIFNPHGLPSRMSIGYLMELLAGKVGALSGEIMNATGFDEHNVKEYENKLKNLGFRFDGKETMYNAITGKKMKAKIYIGNMYYLKLKYMVGNKMHARASGKVALLTRQPIEGRARGGALRLGEMEQQALVAHGASLLLKERYDSDKVNIYICSKCGSIGIKDHIKNKLHCAVCGTNEIQPVEVSYAFKLLLEELQGLHIMTKLEMKNKYE
ncbi:MAG: DNA-directed RNA polymerase subunit B'' [Nanoarchaeota archaeon]|nr:DNA-directed RNA polymerase subunit B'' [Nanoarchaeota archaeon]